MSASETPKSRLETSSFPPVSTPAPAPKPLSNRSCCHFSGSCLGCGESGASLTGPLMISSRDMSILSAMMAAPLRGLGRCSRSFLSTEQPSRSQGPCPGQEGHQARAPGRELAGTADDRAARCPWGPHGVPQHTDRSPRAGGGQGTGWQENLSLRHTPDPALGGKSHREPVWGPA
uniref:Uncharacterized protein n=1 Tax=Nothoprocta perdicaria TaxID=30464 RepID=A0A8C6ZI00_NOTPE